MAINNILGYTLDIRALLEAHTSFELVEVKGETNLARTELATNKPIIVDMGRASYEGYFNNPQGELDTEAARAAIESIKEFEWAGVTYELAFGHSNWLRNGKLGFMPKGTELVNWCGCNTSKFKADKGELKFELYKGLSFRPAKNWKQFDPYSVAIIGDDAYKTICNGLYVDQHGMVHEQQVEISGDNSDGTCLADYSWAPEGTKHIGFFQMVCDPAGKGAVRLMNSHLWNGVKVENPLFGGEIDLTGFQMLMPLSVFKCWAGFTTREALAEWQATATACYMLPNSKAAKLNWQGLQSLQLPVSAIRALAQYSVEDFNDWCQCKNEGMNLRAIESAVQNLTECESISPKLVAEKASFLARAKAKNLRAGRWIQPERESRRVYICAETAFEGIGLAENEVCCNGLPEGKLCLLRNPHISAYEWCTVYNRHHKNGAKGVCILPRNSAMWACLSGADGDGDQVIATANPIVIAGVQRQTQGHNLPITFDTPKKTKGSLVDATIGELSNLTYQMACNCAGKFYHNFGRLANATAEQQKLVREAGIVASAKTMVGVDAGKYQYESNPEWDDRLDAIAEELQAGKSFVAEVSKLSYSNCHFWQKTKVGANGYEYPCDWRELTKPYRGAVQMSKQYNGTIGKLADGTVFELDASRAIVDTVNRDERGNAVSRKRLSLRGASEKQIAAMWQLVEAMWVKAKAEGYEPETEDEM